MSKRTYAIYLGIMTAMLTSGVTGGAEQKNTGSSSQQLSNDVYREVCSLERSVEEVCGAVEGIQTGKIWAEYTLCHGGKAVITVDELEGRLQRARQRLDTAYKDLKAHAKDCPISKGKFQE